MTEPQEFCLRWNNHQATIISVFDYLLENETLVDCTLAAEGQYLKAHKVVLCACSPYLEILLSQHNDKHPILIFKDIKYHELKCMIEYMYKGEVNIAQDQLNHFLKAAESLQIKGLSESEEEPAPQTAVPTPRPPPPRAPPVQRTQPRPFSNAVAVRSTGPSEDDVSKRLIGRTEAQSPTPRKRRRQAPLAVQGRSSISGDDASNASEGHFDQSNCDVPTPSHPTPSDSSKAVAKVESSSELMLEPKTEYDDNDNSVEDITLDDDDEDYSQAGTSQMDNSQGNFGAWQQMVGDQTGDEVFSGQESGVQNSQDNPLISSSAEITVTPTTSASTSSNDAKVLLYNHKSGESDDSISNLLYNSVSCVMDENQTSTEHYSNILREHGVDILPFTKQPSPSRVTNMMRKYHRYLSTLPPAALLALANPKIGRPRKNVLSANNVSIEPINEGRTFDLNASDSPRHVSDLVRNPADMPRRKVGRPVGWRKNRDFHMQQGPTIMQHKKPAGRPKGWRKPQSMPPMPVPLSWKPGQFGESDEVQKKKRGRPRLSDTVCFEESSPAQPSETNVSYIDDGGHFLLPS